MRFLNIVKDFCKVVWRHGLGGSKLREHLNSKGGRAPGPFIQPKKQPPSRNLSRATLPEHGTITMTTFPLRPTGDMPNGNTTPFCCQHRQSHSTKISKPRPPFPTRSRRSLRKLWPARKSQGTKIGFYRVALRTAT